MVFCGPVVLGLARPSICSSLGTASFGQLSLYSQVYPGAAGASTPAGALGALRYDGALPAFPTGYELGLGLKDDLLNQVLWALWYGGAMDFPDLTALAGDVGVPGVSLSLRADLPPVLMRGQNGWNTRVGLGDVYVHATVDLGTALGTGAPGVSIPPNTGHTPS